jgi:hypothetical protein
LIAATRSGGKVWKTLVQHAFSDGFRETKDATAVVMVYPNGTREQHLDAARASDSGNC